MASGIEHVKTSKYATVKHINTKVDEHGDEQLDLEQSLNLYALSMKKGRYNATDFDIQFFAFLMDIDLIGMSLIHPANTNLFYMPSFSFDFFLVQFACHGDGVKDPNCVMLNGYLFDDNKVPEAAEGEEVKPEADVDLIEENSKEKGKKKTCLRFILNPWIPQLMKRNQIRLVIRIWRIQSNCQEKIPIKIG